MGGGIDTFMKCLPEYDPVWIEIAYWTIVRSNQMESLRRIDEDEWPDLLELQDYKPRFKADPDFYAPDDLMMELGAWLRDYSIRKRKERVVQKHEMERKRVTDSMML